MSKTVKPLKFTLQRKEVPVEIDERKYVLKEMDGYHRDMYLNIVTKSQTGSADGRTIRVKNFEGLQAKLINLCLFNESGENVATEEIQKWPAAMQTELFREAQSLNGLDDDIKEDDEENP
jgi:hypothetical protein